VRGLGVTDPELSPNHSWRHTFKRIAEAVGITEKVHDAITGHTPATEGRMHRKAGLTECFTGRKFAGHILPGKAPNRMYFCCCCYLSGAVATLAAGF
jgi:hypothetical protein